MSPPMPRTIRREMARPRPAPPWRRVERRCRPARTRRRCARPPRAGRPGPLSATAKTMRSSRPSLLSPRSSRQVTPPASVNLTPLPARLRSTWRSRAGSTSTAPRHRGPIVGGDVDALGVGAGGEQLDDVLEQRLEPRSARDGDRDGRPRSWRSRACRRPAQAAPRRRIGRRAHRSPGPA